MRTVEYHNLTSKQFKQVSNLWNIGKPQDYKYIIGDTGDVIDRQRVPTNESEKKLRHLFEVAMEGHKESEKGNWKSAWACGRVVGKYSYGATKELADMMGKSPDTVEQRAHAYWMYIEFCRYERYRKVVQGARQLPHITLSHFRSLYDVWKSHNLLIDQVFFLLYEAIVAEGGVSSRDIKDHANQKYGDPRTWEDYAASTHKSLHKLLGCPDLPNDIKRDAVGLYDKIGERA